MRFCEQMLRVGVAVITATALGITGCSSAGVNGSGGSPIAATKTTTTQTVITDAPSDEVLALALTVTGIRLIDGSGNYVDVLTSPAQIEAVHLDAVQEPLRAPLSIPQGTYTSAVITVANPVVTYLDPATKAVTKVSATLEASSTTVTFSSPITVGSTSTPLVFDLLVGQSVAISGTTVTVTPTFNVNQITVGLHPSGPEDGMVDDVFGTVVSVSGTSLTVQEPNGTQVTLATNSSTQLQDFTSLSSLTAGEVVNIDVAQQTDGSLLATRIHLDPIPAGDLLAGVVTATTGKPVTSFTQVLRQALGSRTTNLPAGTSVTIAVNGSTRFALAPQVSSLPSLPFTPAFTQATLFAGQNVAAAASTVSGTTATANKVTLLPQTVDGTVSAVSTASGVTTFTVALAANSTLTTLTGATSVVVYEYKGTAVSTAATLAVGSNIRANGLLFNDNGTLRMLACLRAGGAASAQSQHH